MLVGAPYAKKVFLFEHSFYEKIRQQRKKKKTKEKRKKRMAFLVATTSWPAVYRPNDDRWNAARSCQ